MRVSALTPSEQRKRAALDSVATLVLTMLVWPFPIARALLPISVNVALVLVAWVLMGVAYSLVCGLVWHRTAAMYLLGFTLAPIGEASLPVNPVGGPGLWRWGAAAGSLLLVTVAWPGASDWVVRASGWTLSR